MAETIKNLTTPEDIIHAFLIKDSRFALARFADNSSYSRPYISQHIHGHRKNLKMLKRMANHLGCGIYGVMPDNFKTGQNRPKRKDH